VKEKVTSTAETLDNTLKSMKEAVGTVDGMLNGEPSSPGYADAPPEA
jgi:hypothetical protein